MNNPITAAILVWLMNNSHCVQAEDSCDCAVDVISCDGIEDRTAQANVTGRPLGHKLESYIGTDEIGMVLYPGFTPLDLVGPQAFFSGILGARVHTLWKTLDAVLTDAGYTVGPTTTFADAPEQLDVLFVPGSLRGALHAMKDTELINWIAAAGKNATWVTSACTGSIILGQAGLLQGKKATTHWAAMEQLELFGAEAVEERYVVDGNVITSAGVSAGIDMALVLVSLLRDEWYAQAVQLSLEYDPHPPFEGGSPKKAAPDVFNVIKPLYDRTVADMQEISQCALIDV